MQGEPFDQGNQVGQEGRRPRWARAGRARATAPRPGSVPSSWPRVLAGGVPHHNFHVFGVYAWAGLLDDDHKAGTLMVLDRCRIRWAR